MSELNYALDILKDDLNELHQMQAVPKYAMDRKTYKERTNSLHAAIKALNQANEATNPPPEKALPMCSVINWVAVTDRLPVEEWGDYMICLDNNAVFKANYSRIGTERWLIVGVGTLQKTNPVKYWAELPKPPCL